MIKKIEFEGNTIAPKYYGKEATVMLRFS